MKVKNLIWCGCLVAQSCLTLQPHRLSPIRLLCSWGFSRQEYRSGLPCPPPGGLPSPGIELRSPTLQMDSLPSEPPGKPRIDNSHVVSWKKLSKNDPKEMLHVQISIFQWVPPKVQVILIYMFRVRSTK